MEDPVPAIRAESLSKRFGATVAVDGVSFEVGRGEVVAFLGPNGAGKSTTMRMLTGVFPPSAGRALVGGRDVVREPLEARRQVGYLPERTPLYADMDVDGYLRFVAEMKAIDPREVAGAVARSMDATAIAPVARRRIGDLSKGYRQRVGLAQALLGDPPVLVLDEPTSGLDPEQVAEMRDLVRGLGGDRAVLLSTHALSEAESVCSRVLVMHRGRILAIDAPRALEDRLRPWRETVVRVVGDDGVAERVLGAAPGVLGAEREPLAPGALAGEGTTWIVRSPLGADPRRGIAAAVVDAGLGLVEMGERRMDLEEIFLALVGEGADASRAGGADARD